MSGYVNKQQIEQAKQIDLLTYMQAYEPENIVKTSSNEYSLKDHDSLKISYGLWHWLMWYNNSRHGEQNLLKYKQ